jgi:hypothetical protein
MSKTKIGANKESRTMYKNWPLEKEPTGHRKMKEKGGGGGIKGRVRRYTEEGTNNYKKE